MSYKIDFHAAQLDWQVEMLRHFPEIANKHFYPAMHRAGKAVRTAIGSHISFQDKTGTARSELNYKVTGKGLNIKAQVGWFGNVKGWYVNILEYGAGEHVVGYVPFLGVQFGKKNPHPGVPAGRFVERGFESVKTDVDAEMATAMNAVVNDLAVK